MSLATGNQNHSRADHEQTAEDVEIVGSQLMTASGGNFISWLLIRKGAISAMRSCDH